MVPVFPLYVVAFPYHSVTVRIFEDRYKEMLDHLRRTDGIFVMGRIWRGQEVGGSAVPYRVSTLMRLESVSPEGDSFRAEALGLRRVYISHFDHDSASYLQAEIEEYPDLVASDARAEELLTIWKRYLERCLGISMEMIRTWEDSPLFKLPLPELTLALTPFLRLPYSNLQFLLESRDPNQRRDNLVKAMIQAISGKTVDESEEPWES
ncbi:MAG: hypothetical protein RL318_2159 [Fibrobacterota bacterium]|jgi:Lon protease-like protein